MEKDVRQLTPASPEQILLLREKLGEMVAETMDHLLEQPQKGWSIMHPSAA